MNLESWMIRKQKELFELWSKGLQEEFEWGFQLTSSPVVDDPVAIVIGRNPGIGEGPKKQGPPRPRVKQMFDSKFVFPHEADCVVGGANNGPANRIRSMIFNKQKEILNNTIETNAHFFASHEFSDLKTGWRQAKENGKQELLERYDDLRQEVICGLVERGDPDVLLMFTGRESEILTTHDINKADSDYYPLDRIQAEFGLDVDMESRYRVSRDNKTKRGTIRTTSYQITVGDIGECKFVGIEPHLSCPNIPSPVKKLIEEEISESVLNYL
jgi:hypothetical protein